MTSSPERRHSGSGSSDAGDIMKTATRHGVGYWSSSDTGQSLTLKIIIISLTTATEEQRHLLCFANQPGPVLDAATLSPQNGDTLIRNAKPEPSLSLSFKLWRRYDTSHGDVSVRVP